MASYIRIYPPFLQIEQIIMDLSSFPDWSGSLVTFSETYLSDHPISVEAIEPALTVILAGANARSTVGMNKINCLPKDTD